MTTDKIIVLVRPLYGKLTKELKSLSKNRINPLKLIDDEVHNLKLIYKDTFKNDKEEAKDLLEKIVFDQNSTSPLVFKIVAEIATINSPVVTINASLLSDNDIDFLFSTYTVLVFVTEVDTGTDEDDIVYIVSDTFSKEVVIDNSVEGVKFRINEIIKEKYGK